MMKKEWESSEHLEEATKGRVTVTLSPAVISALDKLAESEHRSRSQMVEVILSERLGK